MSTTRSLCCHIYTATRASAILYLVLNLLVAVDMVLGIIKGKDPVSVSYTEINRTQGNYIFEVSSNFVTLVLMAFSSVLVLLSHRKGPMCVMPFMLFMFVEVAMSLLSLFDTRFGLPGTPVYEDALRLASNLKGGAKLEGLELNRVTMIFGVFFVMYIMMKVYMLQVSIRTFYALKDESNPACSKDESCVMVKLPSYDEALKMKVEVMPPSYKEP